MLDLKVHELLKSYSEDAIVVTDKNGFVIWVNNWFTEFTGFTFEDVKGKKPGSALQGEETDQATVQKMRDAIAAGKGFNVNIINYTKSEKKYWLNINCSPVYDDNNELEYFIAIERDITSEYEKNQNKLNKLIGELQKVSSEKSELIELIYVLTHDLKSPLNNIGQLFEMIAAEEEEIGTMIRGEIARSKALINKILSNGSSKLEKVSLEIAEFNILGLIENLYHTNKVNLNKNKLTVAIKCSSAIRLSSDRILISQVLENLFINAIKYSNKSSQINFEVTNDSDNVEITISNETDLLEEWQLDKLFQPFQNFKTQSTGNSTGIGAFIVQKYLGLLEGTIDVTKIEDRVFFKITLKKQLELQKTLLRAV